jgi:hypothetical protein
MGFASADDASQQASFYARNRAWGKRGAAGKPGAALPTVLNKKGHPQVP